MEVKYRIINVDPSQHSITVRYYTNLLSEDSLATSFNSDGSIARDNDGYPLRCQTDYHINIWKTNPAPTIDEIKTIANNSAPYDWFKLKHDIIDPNIDTSLSEVFPLVGQEFVATQSTFVVESNTTSNLTSNLSDDEIDKLINNIVNSPSSNT